MNTKYDDTYEALVHMAKVKLIMNAHKGNIEELDPDHLIDLAGEELDELKKAIEKGDYMNILEEIADILNFAMAAGMQAIDKYRRR